MGFKANSLQVQEDNRKQASSTEDLLLNKKI